MPRLERQRWHHVGYTREKALKHTNELVQLVVESMIEHGDQLLDESTEEVQVKVDPRVTVNV